MTSCTVAVIGDEILKGHVQDTNSHYLCKELWQLGIKVGKIAVVSDDLDNIADEVRLQAPLYNFVFTTGGIGPTHDDVTLEGNENGGMWVNKCVFEWRKEGREGRRERWRGRERGWEGGSKRERRR